MGLDMYLEARLGLYQIDKDKRLNQVRKLFPAMFKSGNLNFVKISFEAGYWRKANQIHTWFVENVQEGKDDCGDYYVSREDLKKLLKLCKDVLKISRMKEGKIQNGMTGTKKGWKPIMEDGEYIENPVTAQMLLPTASGFFFGSTDYDEYYIADIKNTIKIIERCLKLPEEWDFQYHSSW